MHSLVTLDALIKPQQVLEFGEPDVPARQVSSAQEVNALLDSNCVVAIGVSGGKDSVACALAVDHHLNQVGHRGPRVLIHADLGRVEWRQSLPSCQRLADRIGWELMVVQRKAGDMLARWQGRWANNVARYRYLSCVRLILPWSTPSMRFCTSELKVAVITSALRKRYPVADILNVTGIRRQESANRSRMAVSSLMPKLQRKAAAGITWNPIIEWRLPEVLDEIRQSGLELHEAYTKYGASRVSCAFCILSTESDLLAAAGCEDNHDVFLQMVELEATSSFAFQGKRWLADISPDLLPTNLSYQIATAKRNAIERQAIEAQLPKHLLFTDGWPTSVPTYDEAELLADVRTRVSALLSLNAEYLTGESVRHRYAHLIRLRGLKAARKRRPRTLTTQ